MGRVASFFNWLVKQGYREDNPFCGVAPRRVHSARSERSPFTDDDLRLLFGTAIYRDKDTAEINRLNGIYNSLIENSGADLFEHRATIAGPHQVLVDGKTYSARTILIATGGWPYIPEFPACKSYQAPLVRLDP